MSPHPSCSQQPPAGAEDGLVSSTYNKTHTPKTLQAGDTVLTFAHQAHTNTQRGPVSTHTVDRPVRTLEMGRRGILSAG